MLTLYVQNVKTNKNNIANYRYLVMVNAERITEGRIKGHKRSDGWALLVKRIVEQEMRNESKVSKSDGWALLVKRIVEQEMKNEKKISEDED